MQGDQPNQEPDQAQPAATAVEPAAQNDTQVVAQPEENKADEQPAADQKQKREISYLNNENILIKDQNAEKDQTKANFEAGVQSRAERAGGLGYYKNRADRMEHAGQRKKHGHLENLAGEFSNQSKINKLKNKAKEYVQSQLQRRLMNEINVNLMKRNLDSLNLPIQVDQMFPQKVQIYEQMRNFENEMNDMIEQKLLNVKEDLLATAQQTRVKRNLQMMLQVEHGSGEEDTQWRVKLQGRLQNGMTDDELLKEKSGNFRFLKFFEQVRIEFPGNEEIYHSVNWIKAKFRDGHNFDCLQIQRDYQELENPLVCRISMHPDNQPKKYRLSPQLQRVLGTSIQEETRTKIVGALWQYIKSNRLQESDETKYGQLGQNQYPNGQIQGGQQTQSSRQFINANSSDLVAIFGGQDQIQFHQIMEKLSDHLFEVMPITFEFEIGKQEELGKTTRKMYQIPVDCFSKSQQKFVDFLVKYNYEFMGESEEQPDQIQGINKHQNLSDSIKGNSIKKREIKQNEKIQASIQKIKNLYKNMNFYQSLIPPAEEEFTVKDPLLDLEKKQREEQAKPIPASIKSGSYLENYKAQQQLKNQAAVAAAKVEPEPTVEEPAPVEQQEEPQPEVDENDNQRLNSLPLQKALQNLIVDQNQLLRVLMSEEAFKTQCGDLYNSNLFGEDQSQIVQQLAQRKVKSGNTYSQISLLVRKGLQSNINNSEFYNENKEWLGNEVEQYLEANQKEIDQRKEEEKMKQQNEIRMYLERQQQDTVENGQQWGAEMQAQQQQYGSYGQNNQ